MADQIAYKSHDGIVIYAKPGKPLTVEQQHARFAEIRKAAAVARLRGQVEAEPPPALAATNDGALEVDAGVMVREIFARHPTEGTRLYLAWVAFRVARRPGSPTANTLNDARAALKAEMVKVEILTLARSNGANGSNGNGAA